MRMRHNVRGRTMPTQEPSKAASRRLKLRKLTRPYAAPEAPLRAALFNADQMERHGEALAGRHALRAGRSRRGDGDRLLTRLTRNESVLVAAGELMKAAVTLNRGIAPAGEWLLDNFHLIE